MRVASPRSPQAYARAGGALYLFIIVAGLFAEMFVRDRLVAYGDAGTTARNILASETLFRAGFAGEILMLACDVGVTLVLFVLLKPVSAPLALLAAFFRLVSIAVSALNGLSHFAAVVILGGGGSLAAFSPGQREALALLSLKLHAYGYDICLAFFGFHCLVLGALLYRARYFPSWLGVLMVLAGLSYLTNGFARFLAPAFAASIFPAILVPAFVAELALTLRLIGAGVDPAEWQEAVRA